MPLSPKTHVYDVATKEWLLPLAAKHSQAVRELLPLMIDEHPSKRLSFSDCISFLREHHRDHVSAETKSGRRLEAITSTVTHLATRAVLWTLSGTNSALIDDLVNSVASVLHHGGVASLALALVVLVDAPASSRVNCTSLLRPHLALTPCVALREPVASSNACHLADPALYVGQVHIGMMDLRPDVIADLRRFGRHRTAWNHVQGGKKAKLLDRDSGAMLGNDYRFIAHRQLLSLGIHSFLYLDSDTLVRGPLGAWFGWNASSHDAVPVLTVAKRQPHKLAWATIAPSVLFEQWGFNGFDAANASRQQFNAGVLAINAHAYCEAGFFPRMLSIARFHAKHPLFKQGPINGGNQPFAEIAAALMPTRQLGSDWNCRRDPRYNNSATCPGFGESCMILHALSPCNSCPICDTPPRGGP